MVWKSTHSHSKSLCVHLLLRFSHKICVWSLLSGVIMTVVAKHLLQVIISKHMFGRTQVRFAYIFIEHLFIKVVWQGPVYFQTGLFCINHRLPHKIHLDSLIKVISLQLNSTLLVFELSFYQRLNVLSSASLCALQGRSHSTVPVTAVRRLSAASTVWRVTSGAMTKDRPSASLSLIHSLKWVSDSYSNFSACVKCLSFDFDTTAGSSITRLSPSNHSHIRKMCKCIMCAVLNDGTVLLGGVSRIKLCSWSEMMPALLLSLCFHDSSLDLRSVAPSLSSRFSLNYRMQITRCASVTWVSSQQTQSYERTSTM